MQRIECPCGRVIYPGPSQCPSCGRPTASLPTSSKPVNQHSDLAAPADLDALERKARDLVATMRMHCYASDADKLDALLVTSFAELRAARETIRALEGIAEAAGALMDMHDRRGVAFVFADNAYVPIVATIRARLAGRK